MKVFLGADHRGFGAKELLRSFLVEQGYDVVDVGPTTYEATDDYVDYGRLVVEKMNSEQDRGVLLCGSGHGMEMMANRHRNIRAVLGFNQVVAKQGREHEDANVLSVPTDWIKGEDLEAVVKVFLETTFSGEERHVRRLKKIDNLKIE